jgi:hypothetical protein
MLINCGVRTFIIQILLRVIKLRVMERQGMYHAWERSEMLAEFW